MSCGQVRQFSQSRQLPRQTTREPTTKGAASKVNAGASTSVAILVGF